FYAQRRSHHYRLRYDEELSATTVLGGSIQLVNARTRFRMAAGPITVSLSTVLFGPTTKAQGTPGTRYTSSSLESSARSTSCTSVPTSFASIAGTEPPPITAILSTAGWFRCHRPMSGHSSAQAGQCELEKI